jgi:hypothetical protein
MNAPPIAEWEIQEFLAGVADEATCKRIFEALRDPGSSATRAISRWHSSFQVAVVWENVLPDDGEFPYMVDDFDSLQSQKAATIANSVPVKADRLSRMARRPSAQRLVGVAAVILGLAAGFLAGLSVKEDTKDQMVQEQIAKNLVHAKKSLTGTNAEGKAAEEITLGPVLNRKSAAQVYAGVYQWLTQRQERADASVSSLSARLETAIQSCNVLNEALSRSSTSLSNRQRASLSELCLAWRNRFRDLHDASQKEDVDRKALETKYRDQYKELLEMVKGLEAKP